MGRPAQHPFAALLKSICNSVKLNAVSEGSEVLFYRLLTVCDDYGRYYGSAELVKSYVLAKRTRVTVDEVERRLAELVAVGLIEQYEIEGETCLAIIKYHTRMRADRVPRGAFPPPRPIQRKHKRSYQKELYRAKLERIDTPRPRTRTQTQTKTKTQNQKSSARAAHVQDDPAPDRPPNASGVTDPEDIWALALEKKRPGQPLDESTTRQTWLKSFAHMFHIHAHTPDGAGTLTTLTDLFDAMWTLEPEAERLHRLREALSIARSKLGRGLHNPMGAAVAAIKKRHDLPLKREGSHV